MEVQTTTQTVRDLACDALIVGAVCKKDGKDVFLTKTGNIADESLKRLISELVTDGEFKGSFGEILTIHTMGKLAAKRVLVIGLGEQAKVDIQSLQRASAIATRRLQEIGAHTIALAIDLENDRISTEQSLQAQIEGALLGLYTFRAYQTTEKEQQGVTHIRLLIDGIYKAQAEQIIKKATILAEATNSARDLINEPPNVLTPT